MCGWCCVVYCLEYVLLLQDVYSVGPTVCILSAILPPPLHPLTSHHSHAMCHPSTPIPITPHNLLSSGGHIPYRDSKLTRILQPSLGGNARTAIICNMTPAAVHAEESHSTLRFACRAKCVVNNAVVNEVLSDAAVLKRQAKEIEELRSRLAERG